MKKFLCIICSLLIIFTISSCDNSQNDVLDQTTTTERKMTLVDGANGTVYAPVYDDVAENPYKAENFTLDGNFLKYEDDSYTSLCGIDISQFQGDIDFTAVKNCGVDFVIMRVGYRGWGTAGTIKTDDNFHINFENAKNAGLLVGVYFYSQAVTTEEAIYEAEYVLNELSGLTLDLPVFFDWENSGNEGARTEGVAADTINDCAYAFCKHISENGRTAGVYFYQDLAYNTYDISLLDSFVIWHSEPGDYPKLCYAIDMWQYSYEGKVDGIDGNVDLNLMFKAK